MRREWYRVATVLEEKIQGLFQGLSTNFSRPILAVFYDVVLMTEIIDSI